MKRVGMFAKLMATNSAACGVLREYRAFCADARYREGRHPRFHTSRAAQVDAEEFEVMKTHTVLGQIS
jgi:hypothetical protein